MMPRPLALLLLAASGGLAGCTPQTPQVQFPKGSNIASIDTEASEIELHLDGDVTHPTLYRSQMVEWLGRGLETEGSYGRFRIVSDSDCQAHVFAIVMMSIPIIDIFTLAVDPELHTCEHKVEVFVQAGRVIYYGKGEATMGQNARRPFEYGLGTAVGEALQNSKPIGTVKP